MKRTMATIAIAVAIAGAIACGSGPPRVGDKGDFCSTAGSVKSDSNGKWSCEPDAPGNVDSTNHWVKVG